MDKKPPTNQVERRMVAGEVRAKKADDGPSVLEGYGAVFGRETIIDGWFPFREVIREGAFTEALRDDGVLALWNHDTNYVLGRSGNKTLRLSEDSIGLAYEIDVNAADSQAVSIAAKVDRGDVHTSSFAFSLGDDGDEWDETPVKEGKLPLRTIVKVARLFDISPVAAAAYPQTTVSARAEQRAKELTSQPPPVVVDAPVFAVRSGSMLTSGHMDMLKGCVSSITEVLSAAKMVKMPEPMESTDDMPKEPMKKSFGADPDTRARELDLRKRERHAA
jgi:HK97 family phage prohead protease